jgi:tape measure domain-containing protein
MAATVGSINVLFSVQTNQGIAGINRFASAVEQGGSRSQQAVRGVDRSVSSMNRSLGQINGASFRGLAVSALRSTDSITQLNRVLLATSALMGGLVPTLSGAYLLKMADRAHLFSNSLSTVTKSSADLKDTQEALFGVAQRTRSSFESTVTIYARAARATDKLGISQEKLLRLTETVQKSFAIGGASPQEAQGAAIQLSQGIASDRFGGDEFKSVAENAPVLLNGIAKSLGVTIGKLREMSTQGLLTAKVVTQAIIDASASIDAEFAKTTSTIGQAMVVVDNAILDYVGNSKNVTVASNGIITVLNALANNIDTVAEAVLLLGGAFASSLGGRAISGIAARSAEMRALRTETVSVASATLQSASATLQAAQADKVAAAARLKTADMAYQSAKANAALGSSLVKTGREVQAANLANLEATQALSSATKGLSSATAAHGAALQAASIRAVAFSTAGKAAAAAWSFIGGPFGAALLALGAGMYILSNQAAVAEERANRYAEAIQKAGVESGKAGVGIKDAAAGLDLVTKAVTAAQRLEAMKTATTDLTASFADLRHQAQAVGTEVAGGAFITGGGSTKVGQQIEELITKFEDGQISAQDLIDKIDDIAKANPNVSGIVSAMQKIVREAEAARGVVIALGNSVIALGAVSDKFLSGMDVAAGLKPGGRLKGPKQGGEGISDLSATIAMWQRMNGEKLEDKLDSSNTKLDKQPRHRKTDDEKIAEKFRKELDELQNKASTFNLDNIDQEVVSTAEKIGIADDKVKAFIASTKGEGTPPAELVQIKDALEAIQKLDFQKHLGDLKDSNVSMFFSELDQNVIETARSFGVAESKIRDFIVAAKGGDLSTISPEIAQIRAELEKTAENQKIIDFANGVGDAFGDMLTSIKDGKFSLEDFGKQLLDLSLQILVFEPIIKSLKSALGGLLGGGTGSGLNYFPPAPGGFKGLLGGSIIPGILHDGGDAGKDGYNHNRSLPTFHTGGGPGGGAIGHKEVLSLLEEGESVFTQDQTKDIHSALDTGSSKVRAGGGGKSALEVSLSPDLVAQVLSQAEQQSIKVSSKAVSNFSSSVLPDRMNQIKMNPRKRGGG